MDVAILEEKRSPDENPEITLHSRDRATFLAKFSARYST